MTMGGRVISKLGSQTHLDFAHLLLLCLLIGGCGIFIEILSAHGDCQCAVITNGYSAVYFEDCHFSMNLHLCINHEQTSGNMHN